MWTNGRIDVQILSRDRNGELRMLLQSLLDQTFKDFDVFIVDDAGKVPVANDYAVQRLCRELENFGHRVEIMRNDRPLGIGINRQKIVDYCMKNSPNEYTARLDDDCVCERDYLEKLMLVIKDGYDLASGVTPPLGNPRLPRSDRNIVPVINRVVLREGKFVVNMDDCGNSYDREVILPTDHFRSSAVIKKVVHEKVRYEDNLANSGFREEEFFSFRMILAGFKLGVHTGAVIWHLLTPSGGDRKPDYNDSALVNQRLLNRFVRKSWEKHGDFIKAYHERLGLDEKELDAQAERIKDLDRNLIYDVGE